MDKNIVFKSSIYLTMDKMIENLKKFREEFCGNREPRFTNSSKNLGAKKKSLQEELESMAVHQPRSKKKGYR